MLCVVIVYLFCNKKIATVVLWRNYIDQWWSVTLCIMYCCVDCSGYEGRKLRENVECEIFQTILEEARDSYRAEIVHELTSNTPDDMETNVSQILKWIELFMSNHSSL